MNYGRNSSALYMYSGSPEVHKIQLLHYVQCMEKKVDQQIDSTENLCTVVEDNSVHSTLPTWIIFLYTIHIWILQTLRFVLSTDRRSIQCCHHSYGGRRSSLGASDSDGRAAGAEHAGSGSFGLGLRTASSTC